LLIAKKQLEDPDLADCYNIAPPVGLEKTAGEIADLFCKHYGGNAAWESPEDADSQTLHEAGILRLNSNKIRETLGWKDVLDTPCAVEWTAKWYRSFYSNENPNALMKKQIKEYFYGKQ
jgi:CDP-glucose 4,6-dehydratase